MTDFLSSPCSSLNISKYQSGAVIPVWEWSNGFSSAIYRITLLTTLFYTLDSNPWIWGVHIPVFPGSLPLTYLLTFTLTFPLIWSLLKSTHRGDPIGDADVILITSTEAAPLSSTAITALDCLFSAWPMHWAGLYYSLQNWWCLC